MSVLDTFRLDGKAAIVSGASGALGAAVCAGLADAGASVLLTGRDRTRLEPVAADIANAGGLVDVEAAEADEAGVAKVIDAARTRLGGVDILVTAAGANDAAPIVEQPLSAFRMVVDSHLTLSWLFCRAAGRSMIEAGRGGKIVLIGSQRGLLGMTNYSAYAPAMAGVHLLAKTLACEWGSYGIQVNCLAPGLFRSALTEWMWDDDTTYRRLLGRVPAGRLGEPADMVGAVIFLASAASDWMTGSVVHLDGGYTAG